MTTGVKQMMEAANAAVSRISPVQAKAMMANGNVLVVDVRDGPEVDKSGKIAGAVNVSRGMLEFRADPESPYHDKAFARDKTVILYCGVGRSLGARRQDAQGHGLPGRLQPRRLQGLGRERRGGGEADRSGGVKTIGP